MLMMNRANMSERLKSVGFWLAIIGAVKLTTDAFGVNLISDEQVNAIANGLSTLLTVIGVSASWGVK